MSEIRKSEERASQIVEEEEAFKELSEAAEAFMQVKKIERRRDDLLHKLSRFYVDNYDLTVVEALKVENMKRNHNLSAQISDASWSKFLHYLSYKAERAGKTVVRVSPRGTSEGLSWDDTPRDRISAFRILKGGLKKLGQGLPPSEPLRGDLYATSP